LRYFGYAVAGAMVLTILGIAAQQVRQIEAPVPSQAELAERHIAVRELPQGSPGTALQSPPTPRADALTWVTLGLVVAIPIFIGWRTVVERADAARAITAGALFGALAAVGGGLVPIVVAALIAPESLPWGTTTVGMTAPIVVFFVAPLSTGVCAAIAWIAERSFRRLEAVRSRQSL